MAAIESAERAVAVLAGPGSGKTRVLSHRARHLLSLDASTRALLLTFTNKAAAEMKARALDTAAVKSDRLWASTFHTFGMRLLHAHGDLTPVGRNFEIMDNEERLGLCRELSAETGLPDLYQTWSYLRLRRRTVEEETVREFGRQYEAAKRRSNVVDFDDLIVHSADLLEEHTDIAVAYATQYPHLLVDEFQDTNAAQFAIIRSLGQTARTISVFADDDQAIYRFAGAEAENVRRFVLELEAREYPLTFNYRCRQAIVERANRLISSDPSASGRQMRAVYPGGNVRLVEFDSIVTEAASIAAEVTRLVTHEGVRPSDIAVLGRAAFRVTPLMSELRRQGIATSNWLSDTYEARERRAMRVCLAVVRGRLTGYQAKRLCDLVGIPDTGEMDPVKILEAQPELAQCRALLDARALAWSGAPVHAVITAIRDAVLVIDPATGNAMTPMIEEVVGFEEFDPDFSLEHLIAELALGGVGGPPTLGGGIKVASLHRTKGLQWPHVYVLGLEEGRLPDYRAVSDEDIRQERRACFVGVCRAETNLTLTRTHSYAGRRLEPSRFLTEMGF